ncbi:MAG: DDE-type integrase/transposase/recombinase [Nitrososphaera sp.]|jgi:transposase-like protein
MMTNPRNEKGIQIISKGNHITKLGKNHYRVESQTSDKSYSVRKVSDADVWTCECPDFNYNLRKGRENKNCKHIISCQILQKTVQQEKKIEKIDLPKVCPKCQSTTYRKHGYRIVKGNTKRQRYDCLQCHHKFTLNDSGFASMRFSPQIITECINLNMNGMSLRNISRHIKATHDLNVSHGAIADWVKKYMALIKEYTDSKMPELSDVWSLDEAMINVKDTKEMKGKGFYDWLWTIIDPKTRFVLATQISKRREIQDARNIIVKGKQVSQPNYVITDSLRTYEDSIRKELDNRKVAHIRTNAIRDGFQNRPIERYHNEIREKLKTKRGLGNDESAQRFAENYMTYHNYVREHTGLDGVTPAEASGIDLELGHDKIKDLIRKSVESKGNFATQLGKRIEKVSIVNEKDSIKVTCKGWMERQTWREINDILRLNGFSWVSNGKDSCWLKLLS